MKLRLTTSALALNVIFAVGCAGAVDDAMPPAAEAPAETEAPTEIAASAPAEHQAGEVLYNQFCAECHGVGGTGTDQGPPHVDKVYEPGHHPDASFRAAVSMGVRSHHWGFGDMAPIEGIADEDVEAITAYVRWLQREAGIE